MLTIDLDLSDHVDTYVSVLHGLSAQLDKDCKLDSKQMSTIDLALSHRVDIEVSMLRRPLVTASCASTTSAIHKTTSTSNYATI